jgi:hypothetical protein
MRHGGDDMKKKQRLTITLFGDEIRILEWFVNLDPRYQKSSRSEVIGNLLSRAAGPAYFRVDAERRKRGDKTFLPTPPSYRSEE